MAPRFVFAALTALAACKGGGSDRGEPPPPPQTGLLADASVPQKDAGITEVPTFDPASGFHLEDAPNVRPGTRIATRDRKLAQILLRSTPAGAFAAVDGVRLGRTPVLWEGVLDGSSHTFTFVMAGHSVAIYEFVPVTSGIVHGTLVKVTDDLDAGVPSIPGESVDAGVRAAPPPPPPPVDAAPPVDAGDQDGL